jgi:uncharacterized protein YhaN
MRLRRLDLTRYGKFTDKMIDFGERVEGEPDLHIVYGPNEAGKSTAFSAFLDLLFGIEMQSRYGFLHAYDTMRIGGCLELSVGQRELVRIKKPHPTLRDPGGAPIAENLILGDLAGLDRSAYRTMFSLDDESLEAGGKSILASNGELGQLLFSASAGLSELSRTLADLRSETDAFTKPARSSVLHNLKASLASLKQQRDGIDTIASEYNRLANARDAADGAYAKALDELAVTKADLAKTNRLLAALPRAAALRQLLEELEVLADVPAAPLAWLAELPGLQRDEERHRSEALLAEAEIKRLSGELAAIEVDDQSLSLFGRLDRLTELRARHVTADLDLPGRRRELSRIDGQVDAALVRLGRGGEADPSSLLLDAARSATLQGLMASRSGVQAKVTAATDESSLALQELTEAQRELAEAASPASAPSTAAVAAVLTALRASDHAVRRRSAHRTEELHRETLANLLPALDPWRGSVEQLAAISLPAATTVEAWLAAAQRDDASTVQRREEVERLDTDVARRTAELEATGKLPDGIDDQDGAALRGLREAAWAEHRRTLDPGTADAFEAALRRDDIAGDARAVHERHAAQLQELSRALAGKRAEAARARSQLDEVVDRTACATEELARATAGIGPSSFTVPSPAWLIAWMTRRDSALAAWSAFRQAKGEREEAEADAASLHRRLAAALAHAATEFDPKAELADLAIVAQQAVERDAAAAALRTAVADCQRDVRKRELALQKASIADKAWLVAWRAACSSCWLGSEGAELPLDVVRELLDTVGELGRTLSARRDLADRIKGMEDDQAAFIEELGRHLPPTIDPMQRPPAEIAQSLVESADEAKRSNEAKLRLGRELAAAEESQRLIKAEASAHASRLAEMIGFMGVGTLLELAGKLRDSARKADLERLVADAERDICAALRTEALAEALGLLDGQGVSGLEVEHAKLSAHLEELEGRTRGLFAESKQALDTIEAVGGDDAAARIEEQRRTKLLETEDGARRYLRLRVGIAAAEWGLRAYRDRHRSSMMAQASEAFSIISRGAYRGLRAQPDKDGDTLVALGADGGSKLATDLSKGTRFQLYLALRAAGYQEFAKLRPPVPFIADDIMETFDDLRAEETLRVFEGMARLGQVIYLTHHDHIRAMAERTVPGLRVHELTA